MSTRTHTQYTTTQARRHHGDAPRRRLRTRTHGRGPAAQRPRALPRAAYTFPRALTRPPSRAAPAGLTPGLAEPPLRCGTPGPRRAVPCPASRSASVPARSALAAPRPRPPARGSAPRPRLLPPQHCSKFSLAEGKGRDASTASPLATGKPRPAARAGERAPPPGFPPCRSLTFPFRGRH